MPLSHIFVSKHRKVIFTSNLVIQDITNIPLVSGSYFVKWRLKNGEPSAGQTDKLQIKDHGVVWNEYITTSTEIIINKHHVLSPCDWKLEIYQEQPGVGSVPIGSLLINLSEYATSGPITKRFLLDECKFNSFIKIAIQMTQVAGSEEYTVPPMVKAQRLPDNPMATCNNHGPDAQDDPSLP
ncbi:N-terminal C2 in EEIG1 and EHBP1 proteins-domain-containing protein [Gongronella butleri]|nr:N-terminal C2 in EEIG1 and EHBP1 proteins-domain-containing protein [Gongronella butleri]